MHHVPMEVGKWIMILRYSCAVTRTMGWARDLWSGQADPDPNVHGDTNIHYKFFCYKNNIIPMVDHD